MAYTIITRIPWSISSYEPVWGATSVRRGQNKIKNNYSPLEGSVFDLESLSNLDILSNANNNSPFNWVMRLILFSRLFINIIFIIWKGIP